MRHKPVTRTCLGCRTACPKEGLLRITRLPDGTACFDPAHRLPGRGAYVHADAECIRRARKSMAFERSLRCRIAEELYEKILEEAKA